METTIYWGKIGINGKMETTINWGKIGINGNYPLLGKYCDNGKSEATIVNWECQPNHIVVGQSLWCIGLLQVPSEKSLDPTP